MGTDRQYDRSFNERAVKMSYEYDNIKTLARQSIAQVVCKVPIKQVVISIRGDILSEDN